MKKLLLILTISAVFVACNNDIPVTEMQQANNIDNSLVNANHYMSKSEETQIDEYIHRHNWAMQKLDNGVRVMEIAKGQGRLISYEDKVKIRYRIEAISGDEIYSWQEAEITVGRNEIVPGLDSGLLSLHYGSKAKVIVPSHIAYGVAGDGNRIPQSTILIFDIEEIK